jgi:tetratricopeptide (TPR) repeat protein
MDDAYQLYCEGRSAFARGDLDSAQALLEKSNDLSPHFKTYELLGDLCVITDRGGAAIEHYSVAHALNSTNDNTCTKYAAALAKYGQITESRGILSQVIARNPKYGPAVRLMEELPTP